MKIFEKPIFFKIRYGIITTLVMLLCVFWDMFFKIITDGYDIVIIKGFFEFTSTQNTGAAYGIFAGQTTMLIVVSIIMLALIFVYNWFHKKKTIFYCISLGLICGGAVGNLIDRIFLGYVRDFIKFSFFNFTFNIADACLTIGVILFAIYILFFDDLFKKKPQKQKITPVETNINEDFNKVDNNYIEGQNDED